MRTLAFAAALLLLGAELFAGQWLKNPTPGIPRTADGRADLNAPAPRTADGRPSIAGLWRPTRRLIEDITRGMKPGETVPYRPWAEALYKTRLANNAKDDPTSNCRSEEHTSELQSRLHLVCRLLLEKKKEKKQRSLNV